MEQVIGYDPGKPKGQRLPPEVVAEIEDIAPSTVNDGDITEPKLRDQAVTNPKIAPGAVHSANIARGEVKAPNLDAKAVGTDALDDKAVTAAKAGLGVPTVHDHLGNAIVCDIKFLSATEYAALTSPDPNTWYITTAS